VFIAKNEKVLERNNHRNSLLDKELVNVSKENPEDFLELSVFDGY
jgi:hypothetical protein